MEPWWIEKLLLVAVLVAASGFFSGSETALFSLSKVKREAMGSRGDKADRRVLSLLSNPRQLIVTIILCNELINVGVSTVMASLGKSTGAIFGVTSDHWITFGTAAVTVPMMVLVSEVTPKTLAIKTSERWSRFAAPALVVFGYIVLPARFLIRLVSEAVVNLLGGRPHVPEQGLGEEEFRALVDVGEEQGEVENAERRLIHNVFEFGDRTVAQVMTPADQVYSLPYEMPLGRLVEAVSQARYSRVPIRRRGPRGDLNQLVGILYAKDLVGYAQGHLEGRTLRDLVRPPFFVPRSTKCDRLFREFQRRKTHIALVVDEYGRLVGLVTMEDLLEELFGEISEEKELR